MPTYEFRCPSGHEFQKFYKTMSTAPSVLTCPECGAVGARQLSGGGGLVFKGTGFYLTDYGKNAHRKPAPEKKAEGAAAESSSGSKPEGKAEAKAEGAKADGAKPTARTAEATRTSESAKPKALGPKPTSE